MVPKYSTATDLPVLRRYLKGAIETDPDEVLPPLADIHGALFLISIASLITAILFVGYTFYRTYCFQEKDNKERKVQEASLLSSIFGTFPSRVLGTNEAEKEETMHLLNNATIYEDKQYESDVTNPLHLSKKVVKSSPLAKKSKYFRGSSIRDGNDTMLMLAFTSVMSIGIFLNLHTTFGSRTVCITMVGDEVRWQAVKQSTSKVKRYKLNLLDVMSVEVGKQAGHIQAVLTNNDEEISFKASNEYDVEFDNLCFSLVTQKTSLYLEAASKLDRDSLIRGFQLRLESLRS